MNNECPKLIFVDPAMVMEYGNKTRYGPDTADYYRGDLVNELLSAIKSEDVELIRNATVSIENIAFPVRIEMQTIFDKIAVHLLTQMKRSTLPNGGICAYRGDNRLSCAVGCLIKDEFYDPMIEGKPINTQEVLDSIGKSLDIDVNRLLEKLLRNIQRVHDQVRISEWSERLIYISQVFNLSSKVILDFKPQ